MLRRDFLRTGSASLAGTFFAPVFLPRHVLGGPGYRAPSDTVNVATVGAGGMGLWNTSAVMGEANVVALADIDWGHVDHMFEYWRGFQLEDGSPSFPEIPDVRALYDRTPHFVDFRRMLDEMGDDIDAVIVATPDHTHAYVALTAMAQGKHVYVQKPICYTVAEARALKRAAAVTGLVTQMGNQGHSGDEGRRSVELVRSGIIGPIRQIEAWTDRPGNLWPQGITRKPPEPVPANVDWDLFLGPAPDQPYSPDIHPFYWRGYVGFGTGALGDMGAHILDFPFWALDPGMPVRIETSHSPWGGEPENPDTYPTATITTFWFEPEGRAPLKLTWYDGGLKPPIPPEAPEGFQFHREGGVMYHGERGILVHDIYGPNPRLLPVALEEEAAAVPESLPRIEGGIYGHEANWLRAIRGEEGISAPFSYASDLTEVMLLGLVAARAGRAITYDAATMTIPDAPGAERFLTREYRRGWELPVP